MADEVVLLDCWASPFAMRVRIALAEKSIKYESKEEDLSNKSPLLLQVNPIHKQVPVLIHKGKPVCESLIQVEYIDEVWKNKAPCLLPSDPYHRAQARFWADYIGNKIILTGRKLCMSKGEAQEAAKRELIESLKVVEGELGEKPFFGGESFGYVDIALIPCKAWFYSYEKCGNFSVEAECPKLSVWAKRCVQKESVSKSLADPVKVYEFVEKFWR